MLSGMSLGHQCFVRFFNASSSLAAYCPIGQLTSVTPIYLVQFLLFLARCPNPWTEAFYRYVDQSFGATSNLLTCFPPAQHDSSYFNCLSLIEASCITQNIDQIINTYQLILSSKYEIQQLFWSKMLYIKFKSWSKMLLLKFNSYSYPYWWVIIDHGFACEV